MKILSIGNFLNPSWDGSIPDEEHIAKALEDLGHEVVRHQRENMECQSDIYDFILIAQWDGYTDVMINILREAYGCPVIYWAFDYQADGQEWHEILVNQVDLYLSKRIADSKYPNWRWLSQDFSPPFLDRIEGVTKDIDVLFTGSYLPWATERLETLKAVDEKYNLEIHSIMPQQWTDAGFKNSQGPVMDDALPALIARAKINLSIDHTLEMGYHSDRVAQILCCGGFVMHRYIPMDEVSFKDNVVYFYNTIDCLDKVQYYLSNEEQRHNITNKGYLYGKSNMEVINRVKDLMIIVESILDEKNRA